MEVSFSQAQGRIPVTIVHLNGSFDSNSAELFNNSVSEAVKNGSKDFLLDLTGVSFMSSVAIRSIASLYDLTHPYTPEEKAAVNAATRAGTYKAPHLKLLSPNQRILDMIKLVNLDWYLQIFYNEKEAIAAF